MKDIFTDLYKKVVGFFQAAQEKEEHSESKNVAINRMKLVLMQDRTNLTPFLLEKMRGEMIDVLAKYVEMDKEALELSFEQEGEQMALMLSIPVIRAKDEDEIKAVLEAEEKWKREKGKEDDSDEDESDEDSEEEIEETDEEEVEQPEEEEVCAGEALDEEEVSASPDEVVETEEVSEKKSKKRK